MLVIQGKTRSETLSSDGWSVLEMEEPDNGRIMHYDRTSLHRAEPFIGKIASSYDVDHDAFKAKLSKTFPKKFTEWVESMPKGINLEADELVGSLLKDPVKASLRFEVVGEEIDWFDLKVVVNVDGKDLSEEEIRDLVEARGDFVRTKDGNWVRVAFDLGEGQREAVERLGIDPYDLSGDSHRMHALQLNDPAVKEVFDVKAWDKICKRAEEVKLRVSPAIPSNLKAETKTLSGRRFSFPFLLGN